MRLDTIYVIAALALTGAGIGPFAAAPAAAADFYKGKTVTVLIGSRAGGSYDAYARLMARHMGRHIPGHPVFVPKNQPGAAGTRVANQLYNVSPKDGTVLGATLNNIPLTKLLRPSKAKFDVAKFNWIGTAASPVNVLVVWHTAGARTMADAKKKKLIIGATTAGTTMEMYPMMANRLFGTKFEVVLGYRGGKGVNLAMERGEVQGRGSNSWLSYSFQNPEWVSEKKIVPLFQMTLTRHPTLKDVPTLVEFATNDEQRQIISLLAKTEMIGRSMMAPPGVPADRVALLRKAYAAALEDGKLRADAERAKLALEPISGEELQKMVESVGAAPKGLVAKFKAAVASDKNAPKKKKSRK